MVYMKPLLGAKTVCMLDYSKFSVRDDRDHFILHVGTNDLKSEKSPEFNAESIIDCPVSLTNEKRDVSISEREDKKKLMKY